MASIIKVFICLLKTTPDKLLTYPTFYLANLGLNMIIYLFFLQNTTIHKKYSQKKRKFDLFIELHYSTEFF